MLMSLLWIAIMAVCVILIIGTSMAVSDVLRDKHYNQLTQFAGYLASVITLTVLVGLVAIKVIAP